MAKKEEWNNRYAELESAYGLEPNEFFKTHLSFQKPGHLLLPAEGEGRNALWAAKNGWRVLAFDFSYSAMNKALRLFGREKVEVIYSLSDVDSFRPFWKFDAVGLIYFHMSSETRRNFHMKIFNWLNPGGSVILECFHSEQIGRFSGGPKDPDLFPSLDDLRMDFQSLDIELLQKEEIMLNEGTLHQGSAIITRLVAKKNE